MQIRNQAIIGKNFIHWSQRQRGRSNCFVHMHDFISSETLISRYVLYTRQTP